MWNSWAESRFFLWNFANNFFFYFFLVFVKEKLKKCCQLLASFKHFIFFFFILFCFAFFFFFLLFYATFSLINNSKLKSLHSRLLLLPPQLLPGRALSKILSVCSNRKPAFDVMLPAFGLIIAIKKATTTKTL